MKSSGLALAALLALVGCAPQLAPPQVAKEAGDAIGIADVIEYRTIGEPIDLTESSPAELTLKDALAASLRHDPALQAALARLHAALADARQSRLLPNPVLSVVVRFPETGGKPTIEAGLSAELLSLLQRPRKISAADARLRVAGSEFLTAALDLAAEVQERYASVQAIDAELANLAQRRDVMNRLVALARSRVEAGESSRLDLLTLDAQRVELEAEILETESRRRDERLSLARLLGRPSDSAQWKIAPWQPPIALGGDEQAWIATALRYRPEVQARRWELAALEDEWAMSSQIIPDGTEVGIESERDEGRWSFGPSIALPLLDWGQARRQKADALRVEARHKLIEAQRKTVEEVRRAMTAVEMSQRSLDQLQKELIPLLEQRHEQASAAYRIGEADVTTVFLAEQELQQARSKRIALERQVSIAHANLRRAAGRSQIEVETNSRGMP